MNTCKIKTARYKVEFAILFALFTTVGPLAAPAGAATPVINYPNGFGSSCDSTNLWLENNATCAAPSVHVVPHAVHNASNMFFKTPVNVTNFSTTFTFHIDCSFQPSRCGAGFGFMGISDPNYKSSNGGGYTYSADSDQFSWSSCHLEVNPVTCPIAGQPPVIGFLVKFDLYNYATSEGTQSLTGYYYNNNNNTYPDNWAGGAFNPVPSTDMAPSGINLGSGHEFSATIVNSGSTISLNLSDLVTHANYQQSWPTNPTIGTLIQNGNGPIAYVGFGGGTATFLDDVYIDSWVYSIGAATPPPPSAGACDVNQDGLVNAADVQSAVNQALGIATCGTADLQSNGQCTAVDVQRVVNAVLGGQCIVGL